MPTTLPAGLLAAPLRATIYELRLPPDRLAGLDARKLESAGPGELQKSLETLGTVKVLYRVDQSVKLSGDRVTISSSVPFVTNTRLTEGGREIRTVQYRSVGAVFNFRGQPQSDGRLRVGLGIELSTMGESGVSIATSMPAMLIRSATLAYSGSVPPDRPFVLVSADADARDANGQAVAHIAQVVVGPAQ